MTAVEAEGPPNQDISVLVKGAGTGFLGRFAGRGIHVLGQVILARWLAPDLFGLFAIGWTSLRMLGLLAPLGLDRAIVRFAVGQDSSVQARNAVVTRCIVTSLVSASIVGSVLFLNADFLGDRVFGSDDLALVLKIIAPTLLVYSFLRVTSAATTINHRVTHAVLAQEFAQPLALLLLVILFASLGFGLLSAVTAVLLSFVIASLLATIFLFRELQGFKVELRKSSAPAVTELVKFSTAASVSGVFTMFIVWIDRLLIGVFLPEDQVGLYQALSQSSIVFATILASFGAILAPMYSRFHHEDNSGRLATLFNIGTKWGGYLAIPPLVIFMVVPGEVLSLFFGSSYSMGASALRILTGGQFVSVCVGTIGVLLVMTNHERAWAIVSGVALVVAILLDVLLIPRFGIAGAALGTAITVVLLACAGVAVASNRLSLFPDPMSIVKIAAATTLTLVGSWGAYTAIAPVSPLVSVALVSFVSLALVTLMLLVLKPDENDKVLLSLLKSRIKKG